MFASLLPAGRLYHLLDALHQPAARHAQPVDRRRVGFDGKLFAIGCRVQSQLFGNFIELALEGVARLRGAVAAFGSTGGFIGVEPHTIKLVRGNLIGDGEQRASIIDRCQAIAGIGAAVEEGLEVNGGDRAVLLHASFEQHLDGMASAMTVADLFATERIFDGPPMTPREEAGYKVMRERLALAAEAATNRRHDDAQPAQRKLQDLANLAVNVVWRLRGGPERHFAV